MRDNVIRGPWAEPPEEDGEEPQEDAVPEEEPPKVSWLWWVLGALLGLNI